MLALIDDERQLAYLPITKNASSTFTNLFTQMGWQHTQLDLVPDRVKIFSHIRDPIERHFKGTAEFIVSNGLVGLLDDVRWQKVWATSVMDIHSYPITWSIGERYKQIKWIPIAADIDTSRLTRDFLSANGISVDKISIDNNSARDQRRTVYNRLLEIHKKIDRENTLSYFYDADIVLWHDVLTRAD